MDCDSRQLRVERRVVVMEGQSTMKKELVAYRVTGTLEISNVDLRGGRFRFGGSGSCSSLLCHSE